MKLSKEKVNLRSHTHDRYFCYIAGVICYLQANCLLARLHGHVPGTLACKPARSSDTRGVGETRCPSDLATIVAFNCSPE